MYMEFLSQKLRNEDIDLGDFENEIDNNSQNKYENRKNKKI